MNSLTCAVVRRDLGSFHDGELPVERQVGVQLHLDGCPHCAREAQRLQAIGDALRRGAGARHPVRQALPPDLLAGLRPGLISRLQAERHESLQARVGRLFDDFHWIWVGLGATAATVVSGLLVIGMFYFGSSAERADSLAGVLARMAASGSNEYPVQLNGRILAPRVAPDGVVPAVLLMQTTSEDYLVLALAAVVTQEGQITDLEILLADHRDRRALEQLLHTMTMARFEPARRAGSPVAVNLVWLLAHTTVRGKLHS